jgi:DNA-binding PadR family transcriptional regulator
MGDRADAEHAAGLSTSEAAVLALLAIEGERSGYDLTKLFAQAIGYVWAPAKSQLYVLLKRLVARGLATSRRVAQDDRPDKQLYTIGPAGRSALDAWLAAVTPGDADAFYLKLFVGGLTTPETLVTQVEQHRRDVTARLAEYRAIEPTNTRRGHDAFHWLLLRLGIAQAEVELAWADQVLQELREGGGLHSTEGEPAANRR